jgi:hypothetical protein
VFSKRLSPSPFPLPLWGEEGWGKGVTLCFQVSGFVDESACGVVKIREERLIIWRTQGEGIAVF